MKKMPKILFVPTNDRDVELFNQIINELNKDPKNNIFAISVDRYLKENPTVEILNTYKIPCKRVDEYNTYNIIGILKFEKPDIVVITNDHSFIERAFVIGGNYLGIPTLLIQSGAIGDRTLSTAKIAFFRSLRRLRYIHTLSQRYMYFLVTYSSAEKNFMKYTKNILYDMYKSFTTYDLRGHYGCTKIATTGDYEKKLLVQDNIDPNKIVVTGNPKFDNSINKQYTPNIIYDLLKIPPNKKIISFLTSSSVEHGIWTVRMMEIFVKSVVKAVDSLPKDTQLVIKIHPMEDLTVYQKIIGEDNQKIILCKDIDLYELINASELIISGFSTAALEAMMFDKPVIILNLFNKKNSLPYIESGVAIGVYKLESIIPAIKDVLYNNETCQILFKNREKFLSEYVHMRDGLSAKRVASLIEQMIEKGGARKNQGFFSNP